MKTNNNECLERRNKLIKEFKKTKDNTEQQRENQKNRKNLFSHLNIDILPETIEWYKEKCGEVDYE